MLDHWLFNLDFYWLNFIDGSGIFILSALGLLGVIAKATPWAWDNWITPVTDAMISFIKPNKKQD